MSCTLNYEGYNFTKEVAISFECVLVYARPDRGAQDYR